MKKKLSKKLNLKKETIVSLSKSGMHNIIGGGTATCDAETGPGPIATYQFCNAISQTCICDTFGSVGDCRYTYHGCDTQTQAATCGNTCRW